MLAAVPDSPRSLELVRLVLSMIANDGEDIPAPLKEFLLSVISEAKQLALDPTRAAVVRYPEAIQLALEIKQEADLAQSLNEVTTFDSIQPGLAHRVLETMEHHPA